MRSLLLAAAIASAVACRADTRDRHARTTALAACADAIERAAAAPPGEQVEVVARGCPGPCVGLADWVSSRASARVRPGVTRGGPAAPALAALIGGCHARCEAAVGAAPGARWPALVEACGVEELGVPRDQPGLASEEWLVLSDVARWLERGVSAGVDDGQVPGRIEHVTGAAAFTLPLPAQPGLPATRFVASARARQFVAIGGAEVRTGALPVVRIRAGRLEVVAVPGASPGQVAELDRLAEVFAEHGKLLGADAPAPLVIADAATPIARVLELITRIGAPTAELAVAGDVTLAHPVFLERRVSQYGAPEVHLQPAGVLIRGFGDDRVADWDHLDAELDHFTAVNAPVRSLELVAGPTATTGDLARLLDACVVARVSTLIFAPPTP